MNANVVTSALLLGLVVAWYAGFGHRRLAAIAGHHVELAAAYGKADQVEAETTHGPVLQRCADELDAWAQDLTPRLQRSSKQPELLLAVQSQLQASGLHVDQIDNLAADQTLGLPNARVRVLVTGTMHQLFRALADLENCEPPTRVTELATQRNADGVRLRGDLTVVRIWQEPK